MSDLSRLSDAELQALYALANPAASMSDAELSAAYKKPVTLGDVGNQALTDIKNAGSHLFNSVRSGLTYFGDVAAGKADPPGTYTVRPGQTLNEEAIGRSQGEAWNRLGDLTALASPMSPSARAGEMVIPGVMKSLTKAKVTPPTAQALRAASDTGYDTARNLGVEYAPEAVQGAASAARSKLEQDGVFAELAPKTFSILKKLETPPVAEDGGRTFATIANIDAARRSLRHAAKDFTNPTEQLAASRAIDGLDQFVSQPPPSSVLDGPAAAAGRIIQDARGNYAAAKRSNNLTGELDNAITGAIERGNLSADVANSGQNSGNAIRQRIASLLKSPKEAAGYSAEELIALEGVARGSALANRSRYVGNLLGGGGGLGQMITTALSAGAGTAAGGVPGGFIGAALPVAAGSTAKRVSNALTERAANKADELVRSRSPLYESMQQAAPMVPKMTPEKEAILRALLLAGQPQQ